MGLERIGSIAKIAGAFWRSDNRKGVAANELAGGGGVAGARPSTKSINSFDGFGTVAPVVLMSTKSITPTDAFRGGALGAFRGGALAALRFRRFMDVKTIVKCRVWW